ncbi:MAG: hypothetical protein CL768_00100 [Chloroflexi bacterium]|nr:hypothetical protein [Chloroflexota bacterium]|tara:strand:+ start:22482 stop:23750 length:1269 start_codon:yes stop_codon:yes gene_type:complete
MSQLSESFFPNIKKEEYFPLARAFSFFFFVLASWYALRPVRNEMAIEGGIFNLPYILLAIVVVMGLVNPIYSWVISKIKTSRIVIYCYSFFISNLIIFLLCWTYFGEEGRQWTGRAFYIWCNVYSFFVVSIFWVTIINYFNTTDAKRVFGVISAGGSLGAFFGSTTAKYFSSEICGKSSISDLGPISLIFFSIACLLIAIVLSRGLTSLNPKESNQEESLGGSSLEAFKNIFKNNSVRFMAFYILLWTGLSTAAWMISLTIIQDWSSDPCERTAFFAQIEQIVTPLTLIMQVFFTSYLLRTIGIIPILTLYGFFLLIAFGTYATYPTITAVLVLTVLIRVFEYGFNKPTRETVFTALNKQDRYKSTVMMDTFIARTGDYLGGQSVTLLTVFGLAISSIAYAALPIAVLLSIVGYKAAKSTKV